MTDTHTTSTQPELIAAGRLVKSPLNVRRTAVAMGMDELKASLLAHGLMQNLVATDACDGTYRVIAGGRRLEAIHALQFEGQLPADFAVPCQIVTEEHAREMSLAENAVRLEMHPADQYEAFAALIDQGNSAAEVANRFGIEESLVLKRMKLARVAPELLDEYRSDGLTLECLMAYTVTDDHAKQRAVFESLQGWRKDDPRAIRTALTEQMVESRGKLARFVGLDAYRAAGGTVRSDLFGDAVYLEQPTLLNQLAGDQLDALRKELEAEGWGWVEIHPDRDSDTIHRCGRIPPRLIGVPNEWVERKAELDAERERVEDAIADNDTDELLDQQQAVCDRLEDVEQQLAAFVGYEPAHKALAGCFVSIGQDGTPFIDKGLVRPEHRKWLAGVLKLDTDGVKPVQPKPKHGLPDALRRDLAAERLPVAQLGVARNPDLAFDLLTFRVASGLLGEEPVIDGPRVEFHLPKPGQAPAPSDAARDFAALGAALPGQWRKAKSEAARFEAFRALPEADRHAVLAYCVALTLQPKLGPTPDDEATAYDAALARTGTDVTTYWRPGKDNFLNRRSRDQLLALGREVLGEPWARAHTPDKKAQLAEQLDRAFTDPNQSGRTPAQVERLKHWLPEGMSFDIATAPKPAKAKKGKKAA